MPDLKNILVSVAAIFGASASLEIPGKSDVARTAVERFDSLEENFRMLQEEPSPTPASILAPTSEFLCDSSSSWSNMGVAGVSLATSLATVSCMGVKNKIYKPKAEPDRIETLKRLLTQVANRAKKKEKHYELSPESKKMLEERFENTISLYKGNLDQQKAINSVLSTREQLEDWIFAINNKNCGFGEICAPHAFGDEKFCDQIIKIIKEKIVN